MDRLAIGEQHDAKHSSTRFWNQTPATNSAIVLAFDTCGIPDDLARFHRPIG